MKIKINENQLRQLVKQTLNEMMDEGRPRIKPSYWEIEDYRQVPGMEIYVPDSSKIKNGKFRNPEALKNAFMTYHAIYANIDEQGGVHAYFYHHGNEFMEGAEAWDEDAWKQITGERDANDNWTTDDNMNISPFQSMKGVAKQIKVLLYKHVPNFQEIWEEEKEWTEDYRSKENQEQSFGKGEQATVYNTIPTLRGGASVDESKKPLKLNESKLREIIRETLNGMINTKK